CRCRGTGGFPLPRPGSGRPARGTPGWPAREDHLRPDLHQFLGRGPVGAVVVLTAEQVVVDPGLVRHARVERQRPGPGVAWRGRLVAGHKVSPAAFSMNLTVAAGVSASPLSWSMTSR